MCYNGGMPVTNERHDCANQIKVTDLKHLRALIQDNVLIRGNDCSLNHLDISGLRDLPGLFYKSDFNGDISEWDVSNVRDMTRMFEQSKFNGDLSRWNTKSLRDAGQMFRDSAFQGDVSTWDTSSLQYAAEMFGSYRYRGDLRPWVLSTTCGLKKFVGEGFQGMLPLNFTMDRVKSIFPTHVQLRRFLRKNPHVTPLKMEASCYFAHHKDPGRWFDEATTNHIREQVDTFKLLGLSYPEMGMQLYTQMNHPILDMGIHPSDNEDLFAPSCI